MVCLQADISGLALRVRARASRARSYIALAPFIRLFCRLLSTLLSNFKLAVKFNWIISFLRFEGGSEKFTEVRAGSLSRTP